MEIGVLIRIAGTGLLVAAIGQILSRTGREEYAMWVNVAGTVLVILMLMREVSGMFDTVKGLFGL